MGVSPAGGGHRRPIVGRAAVPRLPALGAGALAAGICRGCAGNDKPVDGAARRLFAGRHRGGVPDRPLLLVAVVAHREPAGAHLLPCAVQFAHRGGAEACAVADVIALLNQLQNRTILMPWSNISTSCAACAPRASRKWIAPGRGRSASSGTRCASTWPPASR